MKKLIRNLRSEWTTHNSSLIIVSVDHAVHFFAAETTCSCWLCTRLKYLTPRFIFQHSLFAYCTLPTEALTKVFNQTVCSQFKTTANSFVWGVCLTNVAFYLPAKKPFIAHYLSCLPALNKGPFKHGRSVLLLLQPKSCLLLQTAQQYMICLGSIPIGGMRHLRTIVLCEHWTHIFTWLSSFLCLIMSCVHFLCHFHLSLVPLVGR